jgi:hypothetical protein
MFSADKMTKSAVNRCGNALVINACSKALGVGDTQISEQKRALATVQNWVRGKWSRHQARHRFQVRVDTWRPNRLANRSQQRSLGVNWFEAQSMINTVVA